MTYRFLAPFYDRLTRWVFRGEYYQAQQWLAKQLDGEQKVLVVGGGTGQLLESVPHSFSGIIYFLEPDDSMRSIAQKRVNPHIRIHWLPQPLEDFHAPPFDILVTAFFLDQFKDGPLDEQWQRCHRMLRPGGSWLVADFVSEYSGSWYHWFTRAMLLFFRLFTGLKQTHIPELQPLWKQKGYRSTKTQHYFWNTIFCARYVQEL